MMTQAALVFVDWDSARRIVSAPIRKNILIEDVIATLSQEVANLLKEFSKEIYRVSWRIYHGWHFGHQETEDRKHFEMFRIRYRSRTIGRVSFGSDFSYGDVLLCGSKRLPLRDTLRPPRHDPKGRKGQKMVDTALIADLLHASRMNGYDKLIVIGDDDDLLPGIITAESWNNNVHFCRVTNTSGLPLIRDKIKGFPMTQLTRSAGR